MTERLWTPWRMRYITSDKTGGGCIFCDLPAENNDRDNLIVVRSDHSFIILNAYPYTSGHLVVVPFQHVPSLEELDEHTLLDLSLLTNRATAALRRVMQPAGFNLGANIGKAAGAGIADHFHLHVVPRWVGDSNFMPAIADTRLLPQMLLDTYDELIAAGI